MIGMRAQTQAQLDLGARGGIETRALGDQHLQHFARGVGLYGIVDVRAAQTGSQSAVLLRHGKTIQNQRRPVERGLADVGFDTVLGCVQAHLGHYVGIHGHLQ